MINKKLKQKWFDMVRRCYNTKCANYQYYGNRGIKICDNWLGKNGFENFYDWAINNGYKDNLSIDRIDNNGNYCPENCRWTTKSVQNMNKRNFNNKTGFIGISKHTDSDIYYGRVKIDGKQFCTGSSSNIIIAVKMRNDYIDKFNLNNVKNDLSKYENYDFSKRPRRNPERKNIKNAVMLTCFRETKPLLDWLEDERLKKYNLNMELLRSRRKYGWSDEKILLTKNKGRNW